MNYKFPVTKLPVSLRETHSQVTANLSRCPYMPDLLLFHDNLASRITILLNDDATSGIIQLLTRQ